MPTYGIYPAIGIARLGNSEEHYIGAESPQMNFLPPGDHYRDAVNGQIKRMGCRFRIYEFEGNTPIREITSDDATIVWEVRLVNSKAAKASLNSGIPRERLIIDSGDRRVRGVGQNQALTGTLRPTSAAIEVKLGNLLTDDKGRLIVLGGHGKSDTWNGSTPSTIHNHGWYDDTSDGPVRASVQLHNSNEVLEAESAWILIGPPDFAHPVTSIVTLYDIAWDRAAPFRFEPIDAPASFTNDIFPILHRAVFMQWTSSDARQGHAGNGFGNFLEPTTFKRLHDKNAPGGKGARQQVFDRLRIPPDGREGGNMPALSGSLTLTPTQYALMRKWSEENYLDDWDNAWNPVEPPQPTLAEMPLGRQPLALTQAALGDAVGGSFAPGIEAGEKMADLATYQHPFRISRTIAPGDLTQDLSVPWQADFNLCLQSWWPGARPGSVIVKEGPTYTAREWIRGIAGNASMVREWSKLGFIIKDTSGGQVRYTEQERILTT